MVTRSAKSKVHAIRKDFIEGMTETAVLAEKLGVCTTTVNKYRKEFREIQRLYPGKLQNYKFRLPKIQYKKPIDPRYPELIQMLPALMEQATAPQVQLLPLWKTYREACPKGYSIQQFTIHYIAWRRKTNACIYTHRRIKAIHPEDLLKLNKWKSANKNNEWKRATVLLGSLNKRNAHEMAAQVERSVRTVQRWIDHYKLHRLMGIIPKPAGVNERIKAKIKIKQDNLVKLLHEPPALHGLNRTSWRLEDLAAAYEEIYGETIGAMTVSANLKKLGFAYSKSREVLTSPDPLFREKLDHIKSILSNLSEKKNSFPLMNTGTSQLKSGAAPPSPIGKKSPRNYSAARAF